MPHLCSPGKCGFGSKAPFCEPDNLVDTVAALGRTARVLAVVTRGMRMMLC
jgi:hypothetical protein